MARALSAASARRDHVPGLGVGGEYRLEGLLVMGDYYFDRAQLDDAEKYYRMVLEGPEMRVHAMARYKLGWCRINRADFKGALTLFEGSIRAAHRPGGGTRMTVTIPLPQDPEA